MDVTQIYSTLNSYIDQMQGEAAVTVTDTSTFYSLGETVLNSANETDNFGHWLVDRIGKTIIREVETDVDFPSFIRNEYEFGAIISKIDVQPMDAVESKAWEVGEVGFTPNQFEISKPNISQTFFKDAVAWEVYVSIPDTMLKTAFTSAGAMDAFITAIFNTMRDSLVNQMNTVSHAVVSGLIAEKAAENHNIVDVLTLYNTAYPNDQITADEAFRTPAFLRYCGKIMRDYISYMDTRSVLYNEGGKVRRTKPEDNVVMLSTPITSAYTTYLESDTFHNDLIKLPNYTNVKSWQGTGTVGPNDADNTSIKVIVKDGSTVEMTYVIGAFIDRNAIGVGIFDRFSAADRNNRNRYTGYTEGATIQNYIDLSENAVVFTLAAPTVTPA